jgi:formate-dependent nitrite reductase membrane component NrfD
MIKSMYWRDQSNKMEVHEWMLKYTRQTEWIERRGILLWLAFYAGGLGGGLYLVSLYFNSLWGMLISWLIIAGLKGGAHFAYLGKPWRFWRMIFRPQTSWLSRGLIFVILFTGFAAIQLALSFWLPGSVWELVFKVLAGIMALSVATYTGIILMTVKGVPFWNSLLIPVLFVLCGILGGFGLLAIIALNSSQVDITAVETGSRWLLIINALLVAIYLWRAANKEPTGKQSVLEQIQGSVAPVFWIGVVALGIITPLITAFSSYFIGEASSLLLVTSVICEIAGGLALRYCILKGGAYIPLVKVPNYD